MSRPDRSSRIARTLLACALPATLLALTLVQAQPAQACPCLTLVDSGANEVAQRALVIVEADALDYVLQLAVEGDASELGWLVPTPAVADDPILAPDDLFERLDEMTAPFLIGCDGGEGCAASDKLNYRGAEGVEVWSEGKLDHLEFAVLSATDGSDLTTWLQSNSYPVDAAAQEVIDAYVAAGWAFVALRVSGAALEGTRPALGPIKIHIPFTGAPVFPVRMSSLSGQDRVSLLLYVAAAQLMRPAELPLVEIDLDRLVQDDAGGSNYSELVREAIDAEGAAMVLEYAGDEPGLSYGDLIFNGALEGKKMVRLHADLPPTALSQDLTLVTDTSLLSPEYPCVPLQDAVEEGACAAAGRLVGSWGAIGLVATGLLALRMFRRRR